jgi:DNA replication protein DnaC
LLDKEISFRRNKQLRQILLKAKLKYTNASIEEIDFSSARGLQKSFLIELAQNDWINKHKNIIITDPTGVGKTFIACALANAAARDFIPSLYVRFPRLLQELKVAKADGSYLKALNKLSRLKLLVIDDFCLEAPDSTALRDILELFEDRHQISSTIITTQIPLDNWHECLGDPTIADAIMDRIVHNAYQIRLRG